MKIYLSAVVLSIASAAIVASTCGFYGGSTSMPSVNLVQFN